MADAFKLKLANARQGLANEFKSLGFHWGSCLDAVRMVLGGVLSSLHVLSFCRVPIDSVLHGAFLSMGEIVGLTRILGYAVRCLRMRLDRYRCMRLWLRIYFLMIRDASDLLVEHLLVANNVMFGLHGDRWAACVAACL